MWERDWENSSLLLYVIASRCHFDSFWYVAHAKAPWKTFLRISLNIRHPSLPWSSITSHPQPGSNKGSETYLFLSSLRCAQRTPPSAPHSREGGSHAAVIGTLEWGKSFEKSHDLGAVICLEETGPGQERWFSGLRHPQDSYWPQCHPDLGRKASGRRKSSNSHLGSGVGRRHREGKGGAGLQLQGVGRRLLLWVRGLVELLPRA